jgi:hypothetical protein
MTFSTRLALVLILLMAGRFVYMMHWEFQHPEVWGNPLYNPYFALALLAVLLIVIGWLIFEILNPQRAEERFRRRIARVRRENGLR